MSAVAWIVLGVGLAFLGSVWYVGWRLDQSARSIRDIAHIITEHAEEAESND